MTQLEKINEIGLILTDDLVDAATAYAETGQSAEAAELFQSLQRWSLFGGK